MCFLRVSLRKLFRTNDEILIALVAAVVLTAVYVVAMWIDTPAS
jgi:hypothetical protein